MQAFLRLILLCGALFFCISNTKAQTACTWQQGELLTYIQTDWGDEQTSAGILLDIGGGFNQLYPTDMVIGTPNSLRFSNASTVFAYLPAIGPANVLTATIQNPLSTSAGELGGEVAALKLNIDFSDAGLLGGSTRLGDLVIHDISVTAANGQTVRQFFATASTILGGNGSGVPYTPSIASAIARQINNAFLNSTPSQFALDHLKRGWSNADFKTYSQESYGDLSLAGGQLVASHFTDVYGGAGLTVGSTNFINIRTPSAVYTYLPALGVASALNGSTLNPLVTSSGVLGGQVVALKLNVDFSDAGFTSGTLPYGFGDLIIDHSPVSEVNGLTVRGFLEMANHILGGEGGIISSATAATVASFLNNAFLNGVPSIGAQQYLFYPCNSNHCPTTNPLNITTAPGTQVLIPLQATDADNDPLTFAITENPAQGTLFTNPDGAVFYTPNAGFAGKDTLLFSVSDGKCIVKDTVFFSVECPSSTLWQQGDMFTRSQLVWNGDVTWYQDYNSVYASQSGIVEVGIHGNAGYSLQFAAGDEVNAFFIQSGTPAALNADLFSTTGSSSGQFGGEVLALRLNIDFSDAGFLSGNSSVPFGDLILYDLASFNAAPLPELDGLSVREVIAIANFMLGGGSSTFEFSTITHLVAALNASFLNGTPSQFALDHLKRGWQQGDMFTRAQLDWDGTDSWFVDYDAVYASTFGLMQIGVPGASGYDIRFSAPNTLQNFFVQTGIPAALNADLLDPTSSASRQFGGEVAALRLNIDFSDAGFLSGNSTVHFGDLILHNLGQLSDSPAPELDGLSVKEVSTIANFMLGGGSSTFEISTIDNVVAYLNASFVNGTPSRFAKNHLALPCNITAPNHCPVTSSSSVTTTINTAFNVALQATDEDNDALSYSISQNPLHGTVTTSSTGAASYTPTAGYYGADEFKFKASDGKCDAEGTVTITIVMCPKGKGSWKNDPGAWPSGSTPMVLGSVSYTQAQLITILNTSPGTGNKADASLIFAHQLIAARLSIANGSPSAPIAATITHADGLLAVYQGVLPYKVKPNTPAGQAMIADAIILENYNNGLMTTGCSPTPALTRTNTTAITETSIDESNGWQVKLFPNPSANSFSITVHADAKEKIMMQVIDMYGRIIETRNVNANSMIRFGDRYRPGTYFVRIIQGKEHKELKLIKLSD